MDATPEGYDETYQEALQSCSRDLERSGKAIKNAQGEERQSESP